MSLPGDFIFINDEEARGMLDDGYKAITSSGLWEWLAHFKPQRGVGFIFSDDPELDQIQAKMNLKHSLASFARTMHHMHYIAKNGWTKYIATTSPNVNMTSLAGAPY